MTINETLVGSMRRAQMLLHRFTDDLLPGQWLHRPVPGSNCAAWIVRHLALSNRSALKALTGAAPEPPDAQFETRFARNQEAAQKPDFGDISILLPTFDLWHNAIIEKVKTMTPEELARPTAAPHPMFKTGGELVAFFPMHIALHAGQISTIRRSLGYPPVI